MLYGGLVYDTLRLLGLKDSEFMLNTNIRPLDNNSLIWGPAFTTNGAIVGPKDYEKWDKIRLEIYDKVKQEDVIVLAANEYTVAHSGDITSRIYKMHGAQAFVTDGNVRDSRIIRDIKFPCFCSGTNPIDAIDYWAIVDYNNPVDLWSTTFNKLTVYPGDYIFGDADGVMVIRKQLLDNFYKTFYNVSKKEELIRQRVMRREPIQQIYDEMGRW